MSGVNQENFMAYFSESVNLQNVAQLRKSSMISLNLDDVTPVRGVMRGEIRLIRFPCL
jgi:hypothetical protein